MENLTFDLIQFTGLLNASWTTVPTMRGTMSVKVSCRIIYTHTTEREGEGGHR